MEDLLVDIKDKLDRLVIAVAAYQQSYDRNRKEKLDAELKAVVRFPVEVTKYYESEERERPEINRREKIRIRLEIVGIGAAIVLAILTFCTLKTLKAQLKEMQRQTEISERPWLSVEVVPATDLMFINGRQAVVGIKLSIKNVGKSIAKDIQTYAKLFPTDVNVPVSPDAAKNQRELCDHPRTDPVGKFDLFPTDHPIEGTLDISAIPSAIDAHSVQYPGNKNRNFVGFYVVGCVSYHSSFGKEIHETRFAYHLIGPPITSPDGKPLVLPNGMMLMASFETGVNVPRDKLGMMSELFGENDAN